MRSDGRVETECPECAALALREEWGWGGCLKVTPDSEGQTEGQRVEGLQVKEAAEGQWRDDGRETFN